MQDESTRTKHEGRTGLFPMRPLFLFASLLGASRSTGGGHLLWLNIFLVF